MKKSTKINICLTGLAILISLGTMIYTLLQDKKIKKIQYELNATNYKPIIKVDSIEINYFNEKIDSVVLVGELNDSTGLVDLYSSIFANVTFHLKNIGNTNAKFRIALCVDTISGDDKLRDLFFKEGEKLKTDFSDNDFYMYRHLQPDDIAKMEFETEIKFVKDDTFAIHYLVFYENDLDNLYDTYYWAKFHKRILITRMRSINEKQNNKQKMIIDKNQSLNFIDNNIAYKTYSKKEKKKFDWIINKIQNAR